MPIQFRCPACDRMLGIARRKAGTAVKCPRCGAEVRVPALAGMAIETNGPVGAAPAIPKSNASPASASRPSAVKVKSVSAPTKNVDSLPLFERPDFESLLNPAIENSRPQAEKPEPAKAAPAPTPLQTRRRREPEVEDAIDVEAMPDALMLTRPQLTLAAVVIAVLMGFAFAAGYLLAGAGAPKEKASAPVRAAAGHVEG